CGRPSDGLVVIDIDDGCPRGMHHPPTPVVETGRGRHMWFRSTKEVQTNKRDWGEIRGEGSYALVPPSVHRSGKTYAFVLTPRDVPIADFADLRLPDSQTRWAPQAVPTPQAYDLPELPVGPDYELPVGPGEAAADLVLRRLGCDDRCVVDALR